MIRTRDRLYGEIRLPKIAKELAETCPVLLRLREIRMANIPFFSYPSFANVDRYEHSLGVAHLTWRWAQKNHLPEDIGTALSIAALYHDGATPAFGHLFEEFLGRFGFDHEKTLVDVLNGEPEDLPGKEHLQVFLGHQCRLRGALKTPSDPSSHLTTQAIANLAAGKGYLGQLIKGDIDFDNIDNVIRASTAMGIIDYKEIIHPYAICDSLILENDEVKIDSSQAYAVSLWGEARHRLYNSILSNAFEFRAQTAIKWAIEECAKKDTRLSSKGAWRITEPVLIFEHLQQNKFSSMLINRLRLGKPPELLCSAFIDDISPLIGEGSDITINNLCNEISEITNMDVYINYYVDKRERYINLDVHKSQSLFDYGHGTEFSIRNNQRGMLSGIVGFVGLNRILRTELDLKSERASSLSRKPLNLDKIQNIMEIYLSQKITPLTRGWVKSRGISTKIDIKSFL